MYTSRVRSSSAVSIAGASQTAPPSPDGRFEVAQPVVASLDGSALGVKQPAIPGFGRRTAPAIPGFGRRTAPGLGIRGGYDTLLAAGLAALACVLLVTLPSHFGVDSWLALADGRAVWQTGVPHHETMTVLLHGVAWVDQQWLSQLATYGIYRVGGLGLVGVTNVALIMIAVAGAFAAARRLGVTVQTLILLFPACAWLVLPSSEVRTQAFAMPLFVITVYLLASDSRQPSRRVYVCLPILILWANLHGSATLGAGLVALRGLELAWQRRYEPARLSAMRRPLLLLTSAALCLLATPYGASVITYYHHTLFNSAFKHAVTEWQPVTTVPLIAAPFFLLAGIALWSFGRHPGRTTLWERLALTALAIASIDAVRNTSLFALAAIIVVGLSIDEAVAKRTPSRARVRRGLNIMLAVGAMGLTAFAAIADVLRPASAFETRSLLGTLAAVRSATARDKSSLVFASQRSADWLLWRDPGLEGRLAYDVRFELMPGTLLTTLQRFFLAAGTGWTRVALGYRLLVLDERDTPLSARVLRAEPGSRVLYDDGTELVLSWTSVGSSS